MQHAPTHEMPHPHAFSIVELLTTILVISLLLAIAAPAIGLARRAAKTQACVGALHQQALLTTQYANDYKDYFPYGFTADLHDVPYRTTVDVGAPFAPAGYITLAGSRPWLAMSGAFGKERAYRRPRCPADTRTDLVEGEKTPDGSPFETPPSYWFSAALYINPDTLDPASPRWTKTSARPGTTATVRQPDRKALLFDNYPYHEHWDARTRSVPLVTYNRPVAAVDGSARVRTAAEIINGVALDAADHRVDDTQLGILYRLMLTPNGVRGVDW